MRGDQFFEEIAAKPPFTKLHPRVAEFFRDYLSAEKAIPFGDQFVVNTMFPPFPGAAFDRLAENFGAIGDAAAGRLYSITIAVTNRCPFACWHCYNAGRREDDLPLAAFERLARELQSRGAVIVTLTGGEPLLREDLEQIAACFDERTALYLGTTGDGLTVERARRLRAAGVFGVGISLDSDRPDEHDRSRGRAGAFRIALDGIQAALQAGLYPYVVTVATRDLLDPDRFFGFMRFAGAMGALEVHLLEPSLTGRLAGRTDVALHAGERRRIIDYQRQVAADDALPVLSSFTYVEGREAFGCGAGLTHLYIDGTGEVCPCNLVPLSFGNFADRPFDDILGRMASHFRQPRATCVGRIIAPHVPEGPLPTPPAVSDALCGRCLPETHEIPRFFAVRAAAGSVVGQEELRAAYDGVHADYDRFWLTQAAQPIDALVGSIAWTGKDRVFEAGCGTGYGTALLAARADRVIAADISPGMLARARERLAREDLRNVTLVLGDAVQALSTHAPFDVVFSSWVLGYIPLDAFFASASRGLRPGGQLAVVVHREHSPRVPLDIFAAMVARDPSLLQKQVAFDFPRDARHLGDLLHAAGLEAGPIEEGAIVFRYDTPQEVLDHLLKSGAGTAFYEAVDPRRRNDLTNEFLDRLAAGHAEPGPFEVAHEYLSFVARKP